MTQITQPRHQQLLQREFGLRGSIVAPHLEPTIQPVVVVSQPQVDEWTASSDLRRFGVGFSISSDGAHPAFFEIFTVPGIVLVVRKITVTSTTTTFPLNIGPVAVSTTPNVPTPGTFYNRRLSDVGPASACTLNAHTIAVPPTLLASLGVYDVDSFQGQIDMLPYPYACQPGQAGLFFGFQAGTTETLRGSIVWDEIALTGER